jgi:hypothetical protein
LQSNGNANSFTGCTAALLVRDQYGGVWTPLPMDFNTGTNQWEYPVAANQFTAGRYWGMVAVTFPNNMTVYSTEVIFDVQTAD